MNPPVALFPYQSFIYNYGNYTHFENDTRFDYDDSFTKEQLEYIFSKACTKHIDYMKSIFINEYDKLDETLHYLEFQIKQFVNENNIIRGLDFNILHIDKISIEYFIKYNKEIDYIISFTYYSGFGKHFFKYGKDLNLEFWENQLEPRIKRVAEISIKNNLKKIYYEY